jgi:capsular exopolysaccharide synthesis family protein
VSRLAEALRNAQQAQFDADAAEEISGGELELPSPAAGPLDDSPGDELAATERLEKPERFGPGANGKVVVMADVPAVAIEQYRRLAASLHHAQFERQTKVLMITSASPGEGKTLTSTNLALTLSESYRRTVLLIDADLRRPSLHHVFKVPNVVGLSNALKSDIDHRLPVIQISANLTLLTAGRPDSDPMSGLTSDRMRRIVEEAAARFDWVIIDTPPVGFLSDANLLVAMVDAALFVVRAGKSPYRLIQRALDAIGRDRVLGVVLNAVEENVDDAGYYYYGYYGAEDKK